MGPLGNTPGSPVGTPASTTPGNPIPLTAPGLAGVMGVTPGGVTVVVVAGLDPSKSVGGGDKCLRVMVCWRLWRR